ncbi:hypothetical protein BKA56DRAFT_621191 [Ilyonectria sp. MPI-CAGE-AT-0026]|nr:hypothetical protein BKA56DRAFT_621191 [Ilyonectria sp. MPI-CAGE-AT-0026]
MSCSTCAPCVQSTGSEYAFANPYLAQVAAATWECETLRKSLLTLTLKGIAGYCIHVLFQLSQLNTRFLKFPRRSKEAIHPQRGLNLFSPPLGITKTSDGVSWEAVSSIATTTKDLIERRESYQVFHGSTNSTRPRPQDHVVDISALFNVVLVSTSAHTDLVETNMPMGRLVEATLRSSGGDGIPRYHHWRGLRGNVRLHLFQVHPVQSFLPLVTGRLLSHAHVVSCSSHQRYLIPIRCLGPGSAVRHRRDY